MIKFKFKRTNQKLTPHYHPLTPVAGGIAQSGSSAGGTAQSRRALALPLVQTSTTSSSDM
jgi:hypothetical protein